MNMKDILGNKGFPRVTQLVEKLESTTEDLS